MSFREKLSLRQIIRTFIVTLALLIAGVTLMLLPVTDTGFFANQLQCELPRHFTDLSYVIDEDTSLSFSEGGYLVPIVQNNRTLGIALYGNGVITDENITIKRQECLLLMPESDYATLMSQLYLQTSDEPFFQRQAKEYLPIIQKISPFILTPVGNKHFMLPTNYKAIALPEDNNQFKVLSTTDTPLVNSSSFLVTVVGYILLYLALIGLVLMITQYKNEQVPTTAVLRPSPGNFRWQVVLLNVAWLALIYLSQNEWVIGAFLGFALSYSVYYLIVKNEIYAGHLRVLVKNYGRYLPIALLCGLLLFIFGTMTLPLQVKPIDTWISNVICNIWLPIIWICFFVFSYLLYELERNIRSKSAFYILFTLALAVYLSILIYLNTTLVYALLNALVFMPLLLIIVNVLVIRTKNVLIPATVLAISFTLAHILVF